MSRRPRQILDLNEHGRSGYRKGCGCTTCRAGHAADVAAWRARKRRARELEDLDDQARAQAEADALPPAPDQSQAIGMLDPTLDPGPVETALVGELGSLIGEPPWRATLSALARANARIVDQVGLHQRMDVLSGVQLRMLDILDRLRRTAEAGAGAPSDLGALLGDPD